MKTKPAQHYRTRAMSETKTPDEQLVALKAFARWVIKNSAQIGSSLDGGDVEQEALTLGIIEQSTALPENLEEWGHLEYIGIGDPFYVFAKWVKKVPPKDASDEPGEGKAAIEGEKE